jgi:hypothetical protein
MDLKGSQHPAKLSRGRKDAPIHVQLGEVLLAQPEARGLRIPGDEHHSVASDPPQLGEASGLVGPVVDGKDGQGRVKDGSAKRQVCG